MTLKLRKFLNALALDKIRTKSAYSNPAMCALCICPILPGDKFRESGATKAHDDCFRAANSKGVK